MTYCENCLSVQGVHFDESPVSYNRCPLCTKALRKIEELPSKIFTERLKAKDFDRLVIQPLTFLGRKSKIKCVYAVFGFQGPRPAATLTARPDLLRVVSQGLKIARAAKIPIFCHVTLAECSEIRCAGIRPH
jgi:hypothetical protein